MESMDTIHGDTVNVITGEFHKSAIKIIELNRTSVHMDKSSVSSKRTGTQSHDSVRGNQMNEDERTLNRGEFT